MPGLPARSPVGGAREGTTHWCRVLSLFLPPHLKINKILKKKKNPTKSICVTSYQPEFVRDECHGQHCFENVISNVFQIEKKRYIEEKKRTSELLIAFCSFIITRTFSYGIKIMICHNGLFSTSISVSSGSSGASKVTSPSRLGGEAP